MARLAYGLEMMRASWLLGVCVVLGSLLGCSGGASEGPGGTSAGGDAGALEAPYEGEALVAFLEANEYAGWAKEAEAHASAGPHGKSVRVYYSPKAAEALNSGAQAFPAGAASVKELISDGSVYGYSVWVKVQDKAASGDGFFWYELVHHEGAADTIYGNSLGSPDCVGCHSTGRDYSLSTLAFE